MTPFGTISHIQSIPTLDRERKCPTWPPLGHLRRPGRVRLGATYGYSMACTWPNGLCEPLPFLTLDESADESEQNSPDYDCHREADEG